MSCSGGGRIGSEHQNAAVVGIEFGRLQVRLIRRVFERLNPAEAARLAESPGRTLPTARDYSLAEVFAGDGEMQTVAPRIGFAA